MSSQDDSRLYDVRTLERNVRKGLINKKDLDKRLKALPDAADKATACNPEAQGREPPPPVSHRVVVTAAPPVDDDLLDEDGALLDDEEDDDDLDDDDDDADEGDAG